MEQTQTGIQHVNVKFFLNNGSGINEDDLIKVFHTWIQGQKLDDLLIDVADYSHVPEGPGIMLIGHNAFYSVDHAEGRPGVLFNRRTAVEGSSKEAFVAAIETAKKICVMLKTEERLKGSVNFVTNELQIIVNDRHLAPNTDETLAELKPDIEAALKQTLGDATYSLQRATDPRARFSVLVKVDGEFDL